MKNKKQKIKSIKVNAILNVTKQLCKVVFPLITMPYVTRVLQASGYGKYNFSNSIVSYFILLAGLGINDYAIREGARVRDNKKKFQKFTEEVFTINVLSTIGSFVILCALLLFSEKLLDYRLIIIVQSTSIILTTIGCDWINSVYEDYIYITVRYIAIQILSVIMLFALVKNADDYVMYAFVTTFASAAGNILNVFYIRRYVHLRVTSKMNLKQHIKPIMMLFFNTIASTIYVNSDTTMLGYLQSETAVGIYGLATKIYLVIKQLLNAIVMVALPRLSAYLGSGEEVKYRELTNRIFKAVCTLVVPAVIGMFMLSEEIVVIIGGTEYISGVMALKILSFALFFSVLSVFYCCAIMLPFKQEKICLIASSISALINVILNFWLIPIISYNGAAITTLISESLILVIYIISSRKFVKLEVDYKFILSIVVGCLNIMLICLVVKSLIFNDIIIILISIFISGPTYFILQVVFKNEIVNGYYIELKKRVKQLW